MSSTPSDAHVGDGGARKAFRRGLIGFSSSSMMLMLSNLLSNVVVIRWLMPSEAGVWQSLTLLSTYLSIVQLGIFNGLNREYSYHVGAGEPERALVLARTALWQAYIAMAVGAVLFGGVTLFMWDSVQWRWAAMAMIPNAIATFYILYVTVTYRTNEDFASLSKVQFFQAAILVLTVGLVWRWGFSGLCVRLGLVPSLTALVFHWRRPLRLRPLFDRSAFVLMLKAGAPLLAFGYLMTVSAGFDRVLLLDAGGVLAVGLYTPALAVKNAVGFLPGIVNQFITPKLNWSLGHSRNPAALAPLVWKSVAGTFLGLAILAALGWFLLPPAVHWLFPQYAAGASAARLMLVAGVFGSINTGSAVLASLKAWKLLAYSCVVALTLRFVIPHLSLSLSSNPLDAMAMAWVLAEGIIFCIMAVAIWASMRVVPEPTTETSGGSA